MAIVIYKNSGKLHYGVKHFVCDNAADVQDLPVTEVWAGSTAEVIATGEQYMFNTNSEWIKVNIGQAGTPGADGRAATIQVGEVTTGAPSSEVSVTNVGTNEAAIFNFSIPRGYPFQIKKIYDTPEDMNADYHNPDILPGELVATTENNETVVYVKGNTKYEFFFSFAQAVPIKGDAGAPGEKGEKGDKGEAFIYDDFTPAQLAALKGADGAAGANGRGIASITAAGAVATVTYDDGTTDTFLIPEGPRGDGITDITQGQDGTITITVGESDTYTVEALQGEDGNGIDNVTDLGDGSILITMTDGTEYTITGLKGPTGATGATGATGPAGPQGPKGDPMSFKAVYDTTQDMEDDHDNPDILIGDLVIVKDGKVYVKTELDWTFICDISTTEAIQGPKGDTGATGPQGEEGPAGPGITDIELDQQGQLIITVESGDIYTIDFGDIWMRKVNPVGTGTMSMNRKASTGIGDLSATFNYNCEASGRYSFAEGEATQAVGRASHAEGHNTYAADWDTHAEGCTTKALGHYTHAEGSRTKAVGEAAHSEGQATEATGHYSHAEGNYTKSTDTATHAEGFGTTASGPYAHAEGYQTQATNSQTHSEGCSTKAIGPTSHAEGYSTQANASNTHTEGYKTQANAINAHAEGYITTANGDHSHAEGYQTAANGACSHAEGLSTQAKKEGSHAEGLNTISDGNGSHAEGASCSALAHYSHAEGYITNATGEKSHSEGNNTDATGVASHAEGWNTDATGMGSHAEGYTTLASSYWAHAEGDSTQAMAQGSHSEGTGTHATAISAHAEGNGTTASGVRSHAEGSGTIASGEVAHAEGHNNSATGDVSHAEGTNTVASGVGSHSEGIGTIAHGYAQHAQGRYNIEDSNSIYAEIVGNGNDDSHRSNIRTLDWNGNETIAGTLYASAIYANGVPVGPTSVPTNISYFVNDVGYQNTTGVNSLIAAALANIDTISFEIVEELPPITQADPSKIYLVLDEDEESGSGNVYNEYIFLESTQTYEQIGKTGEVDISTKMDVANPTGTGSIKVGNGNTTNNSNNAAFGTSNSVSGGNCLVTGYGNGIGTDIYYTSVSGYGNFISGSVDGTSTGARGGYAAITGTQNTSFGWATSVCGNSNIVGKGYTGIMAGSSNYMWAEYSSILGGAQNIIYGQHNLIGGGYDNEILYGTYSTILGGYDNTITGAGSSNTILGGESNIIYNGSRNTVEGEGNVIGYNGRSNPASLLLYEGAYYDISEIDYDPTTGWDLSNAEETSPSENVPYVVKTITNLYDNTGSTSVQTYDGSTWSTVTTNQVSGSHIEGYNNKILNVNNAHVEGQDNILANYGAGSHVEGIGHDTTNNGGADPVHIIGKYSTAQANMIEIVGKGTSSSARSNARTLDYQGNEILAGKLTVGTAPTANMDVTTKQYVDSADATINTKATNATNTLNTLLSPQATVIYNWDFTSDTDPLVETIDGQKTAVLSNCSVTSDGVYLNASQCTCTIENVLAVGRYLEIKLGSTDFAGSSRGLLVSLTGESTYRAWGIGYNNGKWGFIKSEAYQDSPIYFENCTNANMLSNGTLGLSFISSSEVEVYFNGNNVGTITDHGSFLSSTLILGVYWNNSAYQPAYIEGINVYSSTINGQDIVNRIEALEQGGGGGSANIELFAEAFDSTKAYEYGELCTYNNDFYRYIGSGTVGSWDPLDWEETTTGEEIASCNDVINSVDTHTYSLLGLFAPTYNTSTTYAIGDYVTHNFGLFKCNTANTTGAWNSSKWDATTVAAMINELKAIMPIQRELTQQQYDQLSTAEKNNGTIYFVTDGGASLNGDNNSY